MVASGKIGELLRFTSDYQALGQNEPVWQNQAATFKKACMSFSDSGIEFTANGMDVEIFYRSATGQGLL